MNPDAEAAALVGAAIGAAGRTLETRAQNYLRLASVARASGRWMRASRLVRRAADALLDRAALPPTTVRRDVASSTPTAPPGLTPAFLFALAELALCRLSFLVAAGGSSALRASWLKIAILALAIRSTLSCGDPRS